jgi:hypothetical protein
MESQAASVHWYCFKRHSSSTSSSSSSSLEQQVQQ